MAPWMPVDRLLDALERDKETFSGPLRRTQVPASDEQMRSQIVELASRHVAYAEIAVMFEVHPRFVARVVNEALGKVPER